MAPPSNAHAPASMADVAAVARVSHQTVSRVLNQPDKVRPETRQRVEAAMAQLHYRPNAAARALVTRSTRLIGMVLPGQTLLGPTQLMIALDGAAREVDYSTTMGVLASAEGLEGVLQRFVNLNVDGLVVVAPDRRTLDAAHQLADRLPLVAVTGVDPEGLAGVHIDQRLGAELATRHLVEQGARRVAHIAGAPSWFDAQARVTGWREVLAAAGLPERLVEGGWRAADGAQAAQALLGAEDLAAPDAIFCANDQLALGVLHTARWLGRRIPNQLLVAGFDDMDGADLLETPLTSVRQPFAEAGRTALEILLEVIATGQRRTVRVAPELRVRASTSSVRECNAELSATS